MATDTNTAFARNSHKNGMNLYGTWESETGTGAHLGQAIAPPQWATGYFCHVILDAESGVQASVVRCYYANPGSGADVLVSTAAGTALINALDESALVVSPITDVTTLVAQWATAHNANMQLRNHVMLPSLKFGINKVNAASADWRVYVGWMK